MNNIDYIRFLNSSKFTLKEKKLFFVGILSTTIFNKHLFTSNIKIKKYITLYEDILDIPPYKDYLYRSRTLLNSRIIKDFLKLEDTISIKKCFSAHINFIESQKNKKEEVIKVEKLAISNSNLLDDMITRNDIITRKKDPNE